MKLRAVAPLLAIVATTNHPGARTPAATVTPPAAPASPAAACGAVSPFDVPTLDAYARDIDDSATLRLIVAVGALPYKAQRAVPKSAAPAAAAASAVAAAVKERCLGGAVSDAAARALYSVVQSWTRVGDAELATVADRLLFATSAVAVRDRVPVDVVDGALAPFATSVAVLSAQPQTESCDLPNEAARITHAVTPEYPDSGASLALSAHVRVTVSLDEHGLVRGARVLPADVSTAPAAEDFELDTVYAAATSTYAPAVVRCVPTAGSFIFGIDFEMQR